jgi:Lipid A 3-O-deacylase (PagL)
MRRALLLIILLAIGTETLQGEDLPAYSRRHTLSLFAEYSNNSSHIILGVSRDRRLAALGLTYSRRLLHTHYADWHYDLELRPLAFIEDPTSEINITTLGTVQNGPILRACTSGTYQVPADPVFGFPGYTYTRNCGTRWTYAGGLSPLGQRINLTPRHRLQPFLVCNGGFLVSTRDLPSNNSSRFNFTFEFGGGLQLFSDHRHSWAAEYRLHHLSNDYTGNNNPGIDSQVLKLTYAFGR